MGENRLVALRAVLHLHRGHVVVAPTGALSGLRGTPFGYGHDYSRGKSVTRDKTVMLGRMADRVKETIRPGQARLGKAIKAIKAITHRN